MRNIEWLFFDVGSTLVDESKVYEYRMRMAAELAGVTYEYVYNTAMEFYKQNKKGDLETMKLLKVEKPKWKFEYETLYEDTEECLRNLSSKYKIGVIANQSLGTADRLEQFGVLKYIDLVVASAEEGVAKPNKEIFEIALNRAGCKPEQAIMIGDRIDNDIVPAKKLGMKTIWVKQGFGKYWNITSKEEKADYEVDSLAEICDVMLKNKPDIRSLLNTTQNTRDLGGYIKKDGEQTRYDSILRSDVQNYPSEEDLEYLKSKNITTIIDMRGQKDVDRKPSGFAERSDFTYHNFQINEGSGVPESVEAVPVGYMSIAKAEAMSKVFKCIANAKTGVMFNCTAGKDRTGVVAAILLLHAGVSDEDIIDDYVLTKEYGKARLELVHKNFPELDMNIVTPCERFMEKFLRLFRAEYGDANTYLKMLGLSEEEIKALRNKL